VESRKLRYFNSFEFFDHTAKVKDRVLLPAWYAQPNTKVQLTHWPVSSQNLGL
jgi:hypothetical protein